MSEKVNRFDWLPALKRASEVANKDFRYTLCARFLNRAIARIAASDSDDGFAALAAKWFAPIRRDSDCAALAKYLLRSVSTDLYARPIIKIIAGIGTEEASISPEHVGRVCADAMMDIVLRDMCRVMARAERVGTHADTWAHDRIAVMAHYDEKRAQMSDCAELFALLPDRDKVETES